MSELSAETDDRPDLFFLQPNDGNDENALWHLAIEDSVLYDTRGWTQATACGQRLVRENCSQAAWITPAEAMCKTCEAHLQRLGIKGYRR